MVQSLAKDLRVEDGCVPYLPQKEQGSLLLCTVHQAKPYRVT